MKYLWSFILFNLLSLAVIGQSIIITEVFADPKPTKGLPETEFIEIFNKSDTDINLSGFKLMYGKTVSEFPDSTLKSNQYAILVRATFYEDYKEYGYVIALPRLTLNNNGATLRLLDRNNNEIHFVSYSTDWYTAGKNKGYSLEMIDKNFPCVGKSNWTSSQSDQGATPGKENSVTASQPDNTQPKLLNYSFEKNKITLIFDKNMNNDMVGDPGYFELLNTDSHITSIQFDEDSKATIIITLNSPANDQMILNIFNPADCSGNMGSDISISFLNLPDPKPGEIQISEILFNPLSGGQDFVEIHNPTQKSFNLKNWMLGNVNNRGEEGSYRVISSFDLIIEPNEFVAFTTDVSFLRETYPKTGNLVSMPALPAYNNDVGTVLFLKPDTTLFDSFSYNEKMHSELINNPKGVSLEKVSFTNNNNNWQSAAYDVNFATPGYKNSQSEHNNLDEFFETDPIVFNPFHESEKNHTELSYKLKTTGNYAEITILDRTGRRVRKIGANILLGSSGKIKWDGTDDNGQLLPVGYYVFSILVYNKDYNQKFFAKTVIGSY